MPTDEGYRFYVREGVSEEPVPSALLNYMAREMEGEIESLESLMERVSHILSALSEEAALVMTPRLRERGEEPRLFVEGFRYILNQPEFHDLQKFQNLMTMLEEKASFIELLVRQPHEEGVYVAIGEKDLSKDIWDCSLVSASYVWCGKQVGAVGVLGPRRMPYGRIMGLVHRMADEISQALARWDT